jgi:hypothetical protein
MASNAYESMGGKDAAGMVQRAGLALTLERTIAERGLSGAAAAGRLGIPEGELELILGGRFRTIEPEQFLTWLRILGVSMHVTLELHNASPDDIGTLRIAPLPHQL